MSSLQTHIETLENYRDHGFRPGSCTSAILANDLFDAAARADPTTRYLFVDIATWIVNNMPAESYGSWAAVDAWLLKHRVGGA